MSECGIGMLILASGSPRRRELLSRGGYMFRVVEPEHEEPAFDPSDRDAVAYARRNARGKAEWAARGGARGLILAADTVVVLGERVFGKPEDREDARRILGALAGTTHEVITAVALLDTERKRERVGHDTTRVTMRAISADELDRYLASGLWHGKAGAYGIQDENDAYVARCEGSFSNVVGLPVELLERMLAEMGYQSDEATRRRGEGVEGSRDREAGGAVD